MTTGRRTLLADLALYGGSAIFALITALTSTLGPHRTWGAIAAWGYAVAALLVLVWRSDRYRMRVVLGVWLAVTWLPLLALALADRAQEEVFVVEESARRLLETGTPYLDRAGLAALPEPLLGYTPYQPGMSVFGLPYAWFGDHWWTDARIYFGLFTALVLAGAASLLPFDRKLVRAVQGATVLPVCALTLATGGDDLPVLALCLLAMTLAGRGRPGATGIAIGAAAAMKLFAWPVLLVLAFFLPRPRFLLPAIGIPVLALLPSLILDAPALFENVIRFPTGHGLVTSPAASPLLGYLVAQHLPSGRFIALALLIAAGIGIGAYLVSNRPRDAAVVANVSAVGLLAAIVLLPATRFGYLLYPAAFALWARTLRPVAAPPAEPGGGSPRA